MLELIGTIVRLALYVWALALAVVYGGPVVKALVAKYRDSIAQLREWRIDAKIEDAINYAEEWGRAFKKKGQDKFDKAVTHAIDELDKFHIATGEVKDRIVSRLAAMRRD